MGEAILTFVIVCALVVLVGGGGAFLVGMLMVPFVGLSERRSERRANRRELP